MGEKQKQISVEQRNLKRGTGKNMVFHLEEKDLERVYRNNIKIQQSIHLQPPSQADCYNSSLAAAYIQLGDVSFETLLGFGLYLYLFLGCYNAQSGSSFY